MAMAIQSVPCWPAFRQGGPPGEASSCMGPAATITPVDELFAACSGDRTRHAAAGTRGEGRMQGRDQRIVVVFWPVSARADTLS